MLFDLPTFKSQKNADVNAKHTDTAAYQTTELSIEQKQVTEEIFKPQVQEIFAERVPGTSDKGKLEQKTSPL